MNWKKKVLEHNFPWIMLDEDKANKTLKKNIDDLDARNTNYNKTGYYHVYKRKSTTIQGYDWVYHFTDDDGKKKNIVSVDLNNLKKKVLNKGLKWEIVDKNKSIISDNENNANKKNRADYHKTGFYRLTKINGKQYAKGYAWRYSFYENGRKKNISRVDFYKLKEEVISRGMVWKVIDEVLANKTLDEVNNNQTKLI